MPPFAIRTRDMICGLIGVGLLPPLLPPLIMAQNTQAQQQTGQGGRGRRGAQADAPATLGLEQGTVEIDTSDFTLKLVKASQTVAAMQPKGAGGFDFTPADRL